MVKRIIPIELMEKAKKNNIPASTVYKRVSSGMPIIDAVSIKNIRSDYKEKKSKMISFDYKDTKRLATYLKASGLTTSEFMTKAINFYLTHLENNDYKQ